MLSDIHTRFISVVEAFRTDVGRASLAVMSRVVLTRYIASCNDVSSVHNWCRVKKAPFGHCLPHGKTTLIVEEAITQTLIDVW